MPQHLVTAPGGLSATLPEVPFTASALCRYGRLPQMRSAGCNRGNAPSSAPRRGQEGIESAPVRRRRHGRGERNFYGNAACGITAVMPNAGLCRTLGAHCNLARVPAKWQSGLFGIIRPLFRARRAAKTRYAVGGRHLRVSPNTGGTQRNGDMASIRLVLHGASTLRRLPFSVADYAA